MKSGETRFGYLLVSSPVPNVYLGGLMVVNERGLPLEFRYTEPIQPTKIQQVLYGNALSRYIKTDVILETLLKNLEAPPQLLIVNDDSFLVKDLAGKNCEVLRLTETKSGPLSQPGAVETISSKEYLIQLTPETSPVRVQLAQEVALLPVIGGPKSLPDKSSDLSSEFKASPLYQALFETGQTMDVLEPLSRVEKALGVLCQEAGIKAAS